MFTTLCLKTCHKSKNLLHITRKPLNLWRRRDCARFKISKNEEKKKRNKKSQIRRRRSSRDFSSSTKKIFSQNFLGFFLHMCRRGSKHESRLLIWKIRTVCHVNEDVNVVSYGTRNICTVSVRRQRGFEISLINGCLSFFRIANFLKIADYWKSRVIEDRGLSKIANDWNCKWLKAKVQGFSVFFLQKRILG